DLIAPHACVIAFVKALGDRIEAGDVVAEVIDPLAGVVTPIRARYAGTLYTRALRRYASPGMTVARVAGKTPFRSGNLLSP
ncbi:MAG: deacylase, partial [Burkholderiaceae bacterium]